MWFDFRIRKDCKASVLLRGGKITKVIQSGNLPPATSSGPFFFFSSCSASVNSFPPFFSRAVPANERAAVITSQRGANQRGQALAEVRWRACRHRGEQADMETHTEEGKQADNAVNHFIVSGSGSGGHLSQLQSLNKSWHPALRRNGHMLSIRHARGGGEGGGWFHI